MMEAEDRRKLEELRAEVPCPRRFICLESCLNDLCQSKYHTELDVLECLEKSQPPCKFAKAFGCTFVCTCPLRKFIARNFDRWSAESTGVVRQTGS
jgi:hypothetical protein